MIRVDDWAVVWVRDTPLLLPVAGGLSVEDES